MVIFENQRLSVDDNLAFIQIIDISISCQNVAAQPISAMANEVPMLLKAQSAATLRVSDGLVPLDLPRLKGPET